VQPSKPKNSLVEVVRNNEELAFVNAFEGKIKISELDISLVIDLLARWRFYLGINSNNQDENDIALELSTIAFFIKSNYAHLTIEEINLGIDLSLTSVLEVDIKTYNTFSTIYVASILNAYIKYKRKLYNELYYRKEIKELKDDYYNPTSEERMESMIEMILTFYNEYKKNGFINDIFNICYDFFKRTKRLNLNDTIINKAVEYGKIMAKKEKDSVYGIFSNEKVDITLIQKRYSRNYCVMEFFEDINIDKLISEIKLEEFK
jgi:hypothetical protein